jgi:hypothetical protein
MIIFIYSELLYHVLVCFNNKNFMHQPLIALLRVSKEKCDEYTVCCCCCSVKLNNDLIILKE